MENFQEDPLFELLEAKGKKKADFSAERKGAKLEARAQVRLCMHVFVLNLAQRGLVLPLRSA